MSPSSERLLLPLLFSLLTRLSSYLSHKLWDDPCMMLWAILEANEQTSVEWASDTPVSWYSNKNSKSKREGEKTFVIISLTLFSPFSCFYIVLGCIFLSITQDYVTNGFKIYPCTSKAMGLCLSESINLHYVVFWKQVCTY